MIFNVESGEAKEEIPTLKEKPTDLLSLQGNKLTVSYSGKANSVLPAVMIYIVCAMLAFRQAFPKHACVLF